MIVVDASVAAKWFLPEEGANKATALLRSGQKLMAPEIIRIEVASAFTRLFRSGHIDMPTIETHMEKWKRSIRQESISLEPTTVDFEAAIEVSIRIKHQLQDCLYVAVAERLKAPLITADKKLLQKAEAVQCELTTL